MLNFVPLLWLAEELPAQSSVQDKLGGLPWGLKPEAWPKCRECGKSQSLLAQFMHHPERLDLGREGRVLSVFQCNHDPGMCSSWEGGSGANACVVTEPEELTGELSARPADEPPLEREVRISEWRMSEDDFSEEDRSKFFDESYLELPDAVREEILGITRLGGVPYWLQSASEAPQDGWRFIGLLDSTYRFFRKPTKEVSGVSKEEQGADGCSYYCEGPNFGDAGIAYLFLRFGAGAPEGWFFWQCC